MARESLGASTMKRYFWNVAISIDQFFNTILAGDPDETMSSRMGKRLAQRTCALCKAVCWLLDRVQINHCVRSIEPDEGAN